MFFFNAIIVLALLVIGFIAGVVAGFFVCAQGVVKSGKIEWLGTKYRVMADGPITGDDAIKDIIKEQFKSSTFDVDIERAMRRNAARKGE